MRTLLFLATLGLLSVSCASAQYAQLTDEEQDLVRAFRANPAPFRLLMDGMKAGSGRAPVVEGDRVLGANDVIDVRIEGGTIQFWGKHYEFSPCAFRISRGEEKIVSFQRKGRETQQTEVRVAFRADGLHFDVPDARSGRPEPRGGIVVQESGSWSNGEPIVVAERLSASRGYRSEIQNPTFVIRYVRLQRGPAY